MQAAGVSLQIDFGGLLLIDGGGLKSASKVGATVVEVIHCMFSVEVENRAEAKQLIGCVCCSLLQVKAQG